MTEPPATAIFHPASSIFMFVASHLYGYHSLGKQTPNDCQYGYPLCPLIAARSSQQNLGC
ncbi:hypothetical protein LX36DRAFT_654281 [Colletotrichum falcatum]|nr:hypothetical protein LX36DRAFT_654281 [Colletotrichum falcatum]